MLDYVYGHDAIVADFVAHLIPHCRRGFGPQAVAVGVVDGSVLIAGIVYHNWDPEAGIIEISGAALPGVQWLTRETLKRMYRYPFFVCGCQMKVMRVPADDENCSTCWRSLATPSSPCRGCSDAIVTASFAT